LRRAYYGFFLKGRLGEYPTIGFGTCLENLDGLIVGDGLLTGPFVHIVPGACLGIRIGNHVSIADGAFIRSANHSYFDLDKRIQDQGHFSKEVKTSKGESASIIIEDNVHIGARCIILSGAKIGEGSIVAAGAVVSSEIPENSIVAGNPARVIASREKLSFSKNIIQTP